MKKLLSSLLFALLLLPLAVMGQCGTDVLKASDADDNTYTTLKVGPHCWTQFNLKTKAEGSFIYKSDMYPDTTANLGIYGRLYNWYAAMNIQPGQTPVVGEHNFVQGICPEGWHLPNEVEVTQLMTNTAPTLHDVQYWLVPGTNTTTYTMRPGGFYNAVKGYGENLCGNSFMWTAQSLDESSPSIAWSDCHCDYILVDKATVHDGMSVRCVYRIYQAQVATLEASNVKSNQADLNGKVIFAGHDENYTRGFTYGTDMEHPTVDTAQTGQSEEGDYSFTIKDLAENTTYYFRAYVVNEFDTVYGEWKTFTTTYMEVQTTGTDEITMHTTKVKGTVVSMGGYESLNAGFLYGTERGALTGTAQREEAITATGSYDCVLNGLLSDTKYYYCAYLTNGRQTVYGDTLDFTTAHMAVVTVAATNVTKNSAKLNGTLTALRGYTTCGGKFRYGQREDMLNLYSGGSTMDVTGDFDNNISGLSPNTTYYFQALAIHETDTVSGEILSFTTPTVPCLGLARTNEHATQADSPLPYKSAAFQGKHEVDASIDSVRDVDGNSYVTVLIGSQCWMAQNLRTNVGGGVYPKYPSGHTREGQMVDDSLLYGRLYTWTAMMKNAGSSNNVPSGVQGICPDGWHVPSDAEWDTLTKYVFSIEDYKCGEDCGDWSAQSNVNCIAKALSATTGWNSSSSDGCNAGNTGDKANATGFAAVPAGICFIGNFLDFGNLAYFWSATEYEGGYVWYRSLYGDVSFVTRGNDVNEYGYSVRCLRDPLTVTTDSVKEVTNNSATLYGNVKSLGKYTTAQAGFRYGTSDSTMTTKDDQSVNTYGSYHINIINLSPNTTYYFQAYAANEADTVYGEVKTFTTLTVPCPGAKRTNEHATSNGIDSVRDVEGNSYTTVLIGSQCWMAQNLRTTQYANGTAIEHGTDTSSVKAYRYFPKNDTTNVSIYGHLYNWKAVMGSSASSNNTPSGVQGICPDGWHVPSNAEWNTLTQYVYNSDDPDYKCSSCNSSGWKEVTECIAKALASTTGWKTHTNSCSVGNDLSDNNATGFSAVPAGGINASGNSAFFGQITSFWSATYEATPKVHARNLYYISGNVNSLGVNDLLGFSVRCLRDPLTATTDSVKEVTSNSATLYGNVKSLGKYNEAKAGFRYGTSTDAMTNYAEEAEMTAAGIYQFALTGLTQNTTYFFQAYAYNETDTVWGEVVDFKTVLVNHCPDLYTVTDHEGNMYNTVQIGSQCWLAENMRCTTSPKGILHKGENGSSSTNSPRYYDNTAAQFTLRERGLLYNWAGAMDSVFSEQPGNKDFTNRRGICPEGWHLPTQGEWNTLATFVSGKDYVCGEHKNGKALASTYGWKTSDNTCAVGNNPSGNNVTGFSAIASGYYNPQPAFPYVNERATFWTATSTATETAEGKAVSYRLIYDVDTLLYNSNIKNYGQPVRCVCDKPMLGEISFMPNGGMGTMEKQKVIFGESTTLTANAFNRNAAPEKDRNWEFIGWNTRADGTGDSFANQAVVTFGSDTILYAQWHTWCKGTPKTSVNEFGISRIDSLRDADGNNYDVVQIGNQCWMKENLRTTKYANGTTISLGSSASTNTAYRYFPGGDTNNVAIYGHLYNWKAVTRGASTTYPKNPSDTLVHGICPTGWHVPSNAELDTLTTYVNSVAGYKCDETDTKIAKALSSTTGWNSHNTDCAVGKDLSSNNATGFSAVPADLYSGSSFYNVGDYAYFWSATPNGSGYAYIRTSTTPMGT